MYRTESPVRPVEIITISTYCTIHVYMTSIIFVDAIYWPFLIADLVVIFSVLGFKAAIHCPGANINVTVQISAH